MSAKWSGRHDATRVVHADPAGPCEADAVQAAHVSSLELVVDERCDGVIADGEFDGDLPAWRTENGAHLSDGAAVLRVEHPCDPQPSVRTAFTVPLAGRAQGPALHVRYRFDPPRRDVRLVASTFGRHQELSQNDDEDLVCIPPRHDGEVATVSFFAETAFSPTCDDLAVPVVITVDSVVVDLDPRCPVN